MRIYLYENGSEFNRLEKTRYFGDSIDIEGTIRDELSIENPTIVLQLGDYNDYPQYSGYNYVYIPQLSRYYFVNSVTAIGNGLYEYSLEVDVLMTYKQAILECKGFVTRNEFSTYTTYPDSKAPIESGVLVTDEEIDLEDNYVFYDANNPARNPSRNTPVYAMSGYALSVT